MTDETMRTDSSGEFPLYKTKPSIDFEEPAIQSAEVQASWQWDETYKAKNIDIEGNTASCKTNDGHNPCILASEPLTKQKDSFRIKINKVGKYIAIGKDFNFHQFTKSGVADRQLVLNQGAIVGGQVNCNNAAYFTQSETIRRLHCNGRFIHQVTMIRPGDILDAKLDFNTNQLHFWLNNKPQGSIILEHIDELYPAITLSQFSQISILALEQISNGLDLETRLSQMLELSSCSQWQWSCHRKSSAINVTDRDCRIAQRTENGYNPCILATEPLSRNKSHYRIQILKLANYIGIGVTDGNRAVIEGGSILGQQNIGGVNSSYFWNSIAPTRLYMFGEEIKTVTNNVCEGSIVDVKVDFDRQRVYYWIDDVLVGYLRSTRFKLNEDTVYPCVNLSNGTQVMFINEQDALLDTCAYEETVSWALPITGNSWQWSQKASEITIENNIVSRNAQGHNPSIMATPAFSRQLNCWQIKVHRRGNYLGIGFCDSQFVVSGGTTLGTQKTGFNACYFWRSEVCHLRMNGDTVKHASPIIAGDTISIFVDFMFQKVYFYKNKELVGFLENREIREGKLFPCVSMGAGSAIEMTEVTLPFPKMETPTFKLLQHEEFYKFVVTQEGSPQVIERTWSENMTVQDCLKSLNKNDEFALFCNDKRIEGKLLKWKKCNNKIELKRLPVMDDEMPSIEATNSTEDVKAVPKQQPSLTESFMNILKSYKNK